MKTLTIFFFSLFAVCCTGQPVNQYVIQSRTLYNKNPFVRSFTKVQQMPSFGEDSVALEKYLKGELNTQINSISGVVKIGMLIDSTGKPLCEWIENHSNSQLKKLKLDKIFDEMPIWNAGILAKRRVDCLVIVVLNFNRQDLLVQTRYAMKGE